MANRGLHEFTVQEAENFDAYKDWNYYEYDVRTAYQWQTATQPTAGNPAKQILLYIKPGVEGGDVADAYTLYINDSISASGSLLTASHNNSTTTIAVDDGTDFTAGDVIFVNSELMYVSGISSNDLTATRAYGTSVAVAHDDDSIVYKVGTPLNHTATTSVNPIIRLDVNNLPFKISGLNITSLSIHNAGADAGDTDDYVSILTFH